MELVSCVGNSVLSVHVQQYDTSNLQVFHSLQFVLQCLWLANFMWEFCVIGRALLSMCSVGSVYHVQHSDCKLPECISCCLLQLLVSTEWAVINVFIFCCGKIYIQLHVRNLPKYITNESVRQYPPVDVAFRETYWIMCTWNVTATAGICCISITYKQLYYGLYTKRCLCVSGNCSCTVHVLLLVVQIFYRFVRRSVIVL